ncbi:MAG TPA: hypothetical protein VN886_22520 [Acidimicrobiales bacterium]|nr:hypothetical protein [Acidimicrobiales bacterium]
MSFRRPTLAAFGCVALLGVLALGSLPAAASAYKTASQTGAKQAAQCRTAVTGDATVTTKTASDCSWLPPSDINRGGCPSSWGVAVIKVGSASIIIRPGSPPMRLPPGYTAAQLLTAVSQLCATPSPPDPVGPVVAASTTTKSKSTPNAKETAFLSWANQIRIDLAPCEAGTTDVEIALSHMAASSATASDFLTGATAAKNAAPDCSITSNSGIHKIDGTSPPSGYPTLKGITSDLQVWANQDDQQVIIDVGKVADSNGHSTGDVASLLSDSQTADRDAATITSELATAASQAGVKGWKGLGLFTWGLHKKTGSTGSTGSTGNTP